MARKKTRSASEDRTDNEQSNPDSINEDLYQNKNVEWISGKFTKLSYLIIILFIFGVLYSTQIFSIAKCWTSVNILHAFVCEKFPLLFILLFSLTIISKR